MKSSSGSIIPIDTLLRMERIIGPDQVERFQRLRGGQGDGQSGAGLFLGPGDQGDAGSREPIPARRLPDRLDRLRLPGAGNPGAPAARR